MRDGDGPRRAMAVSERAKAQLERPPRAGKVREVGSVAVLVAAVGVRLGGRDDRAARDRLALQP